jgi:hypothetical protein
MKGQSEIIVFILLFLIGIALFSAAFVFSTGIFNQNIDIAKVTSAENTMKSLDSKIQSVIGYGGSQTIDYPINENIEVLDSQTLEIRFPASVEIPRYWINVTTQQRSYIREMRDGEMFRIQLVYPGTEDLEVEFFSDTAISKPSSITIEKASTSTVMGKAIVRIKLIFK